MKAHLLLCVAAAASLAVAAPALAHPGGGGGGGMMKGSAGMGMGPSSGSFHEHSFGSQQSFRSHESSTTRQSHGTHGTHALSHRTAALSANSRAANVLGNLNAAHTSSMALQHASSRSMVGAIATYRTSMHNALALSNTTDRTNAIIAARQQLALRSNKRLTPTAVTRVDGLIGISGADPTLGTTP